MIKNFENACVKMSEARAMENDAEKVLDVLMQSDKPMRAKEIAEACGWMLWQSANYQRANWPLRWLRKLGMIERIEITGEPIEIDDEQWVTDYDDGQPQYVEVNGVRYIREDTLGYRNSMHGHWETVKKTIVPKVAVYQIIA